MVLSDTKVSPIPSSNCFALRRRDVILPPRMKSIGGNARDVALMATDAKRGILIAEPYDPILETKTAIVAGASRGIGA